MAPGAANELAELRQEVQRLSQALRHLEEGLESARKGASDHPPVRFEVAHLSVDKLEFRLDSIDVEGLSGEPNIGITHSLKAGNRTVKVQPLKPEPPKQEPPKKEPPKKEPPESPAENPGGTARLLGGPTQGRTRHPLLPSSLVSRWMKSALPAAGEARPVGGSATGLPAGGNPGSRLQLWPLPEE